MMSESGNGQNYLPSGKRVVLEWYIRGIVLGDNPSLVHLCPAEALGLKIIGARTG
jgi:hypothetical protein